MLTSSQQQHQQPRTDRHDSQCLHGLNHSDDGRMVPQQPPRIDPNVKGVGTLYSLYSIFRTLEKGTDPFVSFVVRETGFIQC